MEPTRPEPIKNLPIGFKPREFILGIVVAAVIVFSVAGTRWLVRARTTTPPAVASPTLTNSVSR